jgi:hypothetical protein
MIEWNQMKNFILFGIIIILINLVVVLYNKKPIVIEKEVPKEIIKEVIVEKIVEKPIPPRPSPGKNSRRRT